MRVADMMKPDGHVFLKSVFGQIDDSWPCMSYSKASEGSWLRQHFNPDRDVMIYVGTLNAALTKNPDHRGRLLASIVIQPSQVLETRKIIAKEYIAEFGNRWPLAMPVLNAAWMIGPPFPSAYDVIPNAYSQLGKVENRAAGVEVIEGERDAVRRLNVDQLQLNLSPDVQAYVGLKADVLKAPKNIGQEADRMARLVIERAKASGMQRLGTNPARSAPNYSTLYALLIRKWQSDQRGLCAICGGLLVAGTASRMLQASADRVDSAVGAYDEANLQVTHLACNLAKNQYGIDQVEEWLSVVRAAVLPDQELHQEG